MCLAICTARSKLSFKYMKNEWRCCNCSDYHRLSLVLPIVCPRSVTFSVLKLQAGDYSAHSLIWVYKNNILQLFPLVLIANFKALVFEAQAILTCSMNKSLKVYG